MHYCCYIHTLHTYIRTYVYVHEYYYVSLCAHISEYMLISFCGPLLAIASSQALFSPFLSFSKLQFSLPLSLFVYAIGYCSLVLLHASLYIISLCLVFLSFIHIDLLLFCRHVFGCNFPPFHYDPYSALHLFLLCQTLVFIYKAQRRNNASTRVSKI